MSVKVLLAIDEVEFSYTYRIILLSRVLLKKTVNIHFIAGPKMLVCRTRSIDSTHITAT